MKFIYITDTHIGAGDTGYIKQNRYTGNFPEIFYALYEKHIKDKDIDFVIHGGDAVDFPDESNIEKTLEMLDFKIPVYLCVGNHDLWSADAKKLWLTKAERFFPNKNLSYVIRHSGYKIYVLPNQWCEHPYLWQKEFYPFFSQEQEDLVSYERSGELKGISILVTHNPVFGVSKEQTGFDEDYHVPPDVFREQVLALIEKDQDIRLVISGHNHINTRYKNGTSNFITASSLTEVPFEFKLFEIEGGYIKMNTISLMPDLTFKSVYDFNSTYVQGRGKDRMI